MKNASWEKTHLFDARYNVFSYSEPQDFLFDPENLVRFPRKKNNPDIDENRNSYQILNENSRRKQKPLLGILICYTNWKILSPYLFMFH